MVNEMEFKVLPIKNKELFLKYAIPCGGVLVRRGELKKELLSDLTLRVEHGQDVNSPIENNFKVASRMCTILAKKMGKAEIDDEVIRRYFMFEHEKAIEWRKQIHPDINIRDCMVYPGKVIKADDGKVLVKTPLGEAFFNNVFDKELNAGDKVTTHYDYVSEKAKTDHIGKMMNRMKR